MREKEKRPETLWFQAFADTSDEEDRTLDLTDANRTLSQLSYAPIYHIKLTMGNIIS